ncbi:MAG: type II toxin-antitoxin system RelE/ParE family toxin [Solirubrobacteraceae bacterium]
MGVPRTRPAQPRPREAVTTPEFDRWFQGLNAELRGHVREAIDHVVEAGPTLGRPRVDVIHGSSIHKLKEARINRGTRVLFAFDSDRNPVMLLGGDKTGQWNRWYPEKIRLAERLYVDHERSIGKEAQWRGQRDVGRTSAQLSR